MPEVEFELGLTLKIPDRDYEFWRPSIRLAVDTDKPIHPQIDIQLEAFEQMWHRGMDRLIDLANEGTADIKEIDVTRFREAFSKVVSAVKSNTSRIEQLEKSN